MARSPESERVAEAIRAAMKSQHLSGADLAREIEKIRGTRPHAMWISKRVHGDVHLVRPTGLFGPTEDLKEIAAALGVDVAELVAPANQNGSQSSSARLIRTRHAHHGTAAELDVTVRVVEVYPGCFGVVCNGNEVGHECSGREDVLIEPGDTWGQRENAVEFADRHVAEHEGRTPSTDGETR